MLRLCLISFLLMAAIAAVQLRNEEEDNSLHSPEEFKVESSKESSTKSDGFDTNSTDVNNTSSDLFVIRSIVYEIGILTDAGNDTDFDNTTHERVDISFFDPENNGSFIDLSNIPVPVQTNVSGVSVTGFAPANFGDLLLLKNGTPTVEGSHFPKYPNKQVKVTHNVTTVNKDNSDFILSGLPEILGLKYWINSDSHNKEGNGNASHKLDEKNEERDVSNERDKEDNKAEESVTDKKDN